MASEAGLDYHFERAVMVSSQKHINSYSLPSPAIWATKPKSVSFTPTYPKAKALPTTTHSYNWAWRLGLMPQNFRPPLPTNNMPIRLVRTYRKPGTSESTEYPSLSSIVNTPFREHNRHRLFSKPFANPSVNGKNSTRNPNSTFSRATVAPSTACANNPHPNTQKTDHTTPKKSGWFCFISGYNRYSPLTFSPLTFSSQISHHHRSNRHTKHSRHIRSGAIDTRFFMTPVIRL